MLSYFCFIVNFYHIFDIIFIFVHHTYHKLEYNKNLPHNYRRFQSVIKNVAVSAALLLRSLMAYWKATSLKIIYGNMWCVVKQYFIYFISPQPHSDRHTQSYPVLSKLFGSFLPSQLGNPTHLLYHEV